MSDEIQDKVINNYLRVKRIPYTTMPKTKKRNRINIYFDNELQLHQWLRAKSVRENVSCNKLLVGIFKEAMERDQQGVQSAQD